MGLPKAKTTSDQCTMMAEMREEIARLDVILVQLIAERQGYIEATARTKPRADEVRLPWRIEDVVAKVLVEASKQGLSKRIAEPVWREMIDRCIDHDHEIWAMTHISEKEKA